MKSQLLFQVLLLMAFSAVATTQNSQSPQTSTFQNKPQIPQVQDKMAVNRDDAEILGIYHSINQAELDSAKFADKKMNFLNLSGKQIVAQTKQDHSNLEQILKNVERSQSLSAKESLLQKQIQQQSQQRLKALENLKGEDFNRSFLQSQMQFHAQAMAILGKDLIPNAKNPQLKDALQKGLTAMQMHYQQAGTDHNLSEEKKSGSSTAPAPTSGSK